MSEKAGLSVSLRFPSIYSLRKHFSSGDQTDKKKMPALDEKYVLGSEIAGELLMRRIAAEELAERKSSWGFWAYERASSPAPVISGSSTGIARKGSCWSELKCNGMVRWGRRRQVRFLSRHAENHDNLKLLSQSVEHGQTAKEKPTYLDNEETTEDRETEVERSPELKEKRDQDEEDEAKEDGDEEDAEPSTEIITRKSRKRKCKGQKRTRASKRAKRDQKPQVVKVHSHGKRKVIKGSIDRWSAER